MSGERLNRRQPFQGKPDSLQRRQAAVEKSWQKQERRLAEAVPGGELVRGSGCSTRASRKSDVTGKWARGEAKTTSKKSIPVTRAHLDKIRSEALMNGQTPVFAFGFDDDDRRPRDDWLAFPLPVAHSLMALADAVLENNIEEARELARRFRG